MTTVTPTLSHVFALDPDGDGIWIGHSDGVKLPQLYGGQLVAQSLVAADLDTEADREVHSIHTTFLRPGSSQIPIRFQIERLRDGRQFSTRVVDAVQDGRIICRSTVSFTVGQEGLTHSRPRPMTGAPSDAVPLAVLAEADGGLGIYWEDFTFVDVLVAPVDESLGADRSAAGVRNIWMRVNEDLGDSPILHRAALAYASDLMLMATAVAPHGCPTGHEQSMARRWNGVSLDHQVWFHHDVRSDDWLLFEHVSPMASGGRVLVEAAAFGPSGDQVAHIAQEAFLRENPPGSDPAEDADSFASGAEERQGS